MGEKFNIDKGIKFEKTNFKDPAFGTENPPLKDESYKKTALAIVAAGVILIILILGLTSLKHIFNKDTEEKKEKIQVIQQNTTDTQPPINQNTTNALRPLEQINTATKQLNEGGNKRLIIIPKNKEWVEFKRDNLNLIFDRTIEGLFTITDIKHYAKVTAKSEEVYLKSILKGCISGLEGTYEIEVPYNAGRYLNIGDSLKIRYVLVVEENIKFIDKVEY